MIEQLSLDLIPNGNQNRDSFFNTIKSENPELATYQKQAKYQEQRVKKLFESGEKITALEACRRTGLNHDSGKRAVTNLKNKSILTKLSKFEMIREEFGKLNHVYQLTKFVSEESKKLIEKEIEEKIKRNGI